MHTVCGVRVCKINRSRGQKRNNTARDWIEVVTSRTIVYRGTVLLCFYLVIVAYLINQNRSHSRFCPCPNGIIRKFIQSNNWLNICVRVCVYAVLETNWKYRWWARTKKTAIGITVLCPTRQPYWSSRRLNNSIEKTNTHTRWIGDFYNSIEIADDIQKSSAHTVE